MAYRKRSSLLVTLCLIFLSAGPCAAAWPGIREKVATLREQGQFEAAIKLLNKANIKDPSDRTDRAFLSGWITLRNRGNAQDSIVQFHEMAKAAGKIKNQMKRERMLSKAGYWVARALVELGDHEDAANFYLAAAQYRYTYYGQLAAAEAGSPLKSTDLVKLKVKLPQLDIYWFDNRIQRELVLAIIKKESNFNQAAVSPKGAVGIMQLLPGTARQIVNGANASYSDRLVRDNKDYNIAVGSKHLADLVNYYGGNTLLAVASYNAGKAAVDSWVDRFGDPRAEQVDAIDWVEKIPYWETRNYVQRVLSDFVNYLVLYQQ